jgi:hypothetical protein
LVAPKAYLNQLESNDLISLNVTTSRSVPIAAKPTRAIHSRVRSPNARPRMVSAVYITI